MRFLIKLWGQPFIVRLTIYIILVYLLFLIKDAFAIVLWFLFSIIIYYIIFAKNIFKSKTFYEKNF